MTLGFTYAVPAARIVFGAGAVGQAAAELERLGARRALVLTTPGQAAAGAALAERLGPLAAGVFSGAVMHTPVEVTERALEQLTALQADCVVALGGGSTIGLGKAIAWRTGLSQLAIPTTYAGSEVTPILGQTEGGAKTTFRDPKVLPNVVLYDPELTLGLPVAISVASGLNALAHAAEGLYAEDRNPVASLMAGEAARALARALPGIVAAPQARAAREQALYGAWLAGAVLGQVGDVAASQALPHAGRQLRLAACGDPCGAACRTRSASTPLPCPSCLRRLQRPSAARPGRHCSTLPQRLAHRGALKDLGMKAADLDRAAELATRNPYSNPRPIERGAVRALLQAAWEGARPAG